MPAEAAPVASTGGAERRRRLWPPSRRPGPGPASPRAGRGGHARKPGRLRRRPHRATRLVLALSLAAGMLGAWETASPGPRAAAAGLGVGYGPGWTGWIGSYQAYDGTMVYCADILADAPDGEQREPGPTNALNGNSDPEQLRALNYILSTYGATDEPQRAAAVQMAVWYVGGQVDLDGTVIVAGGHGAYAQGSRLGEGSFFGGIVDGPAVMQLVQDMFAEAAEKARPQPGEPQPIVFTEHRVTAEGESGAITVPPGYDWIELGSARFEGMRQGDRIPSPAGRYAWIGVAPEGATEYVVEVRAHRSDDYYPSTVQIYPPVYLGQQDLVAGVGAVHEGRDDVWRDPVPVLLQFQPTVTTVASTRFVPVGSTFADAVTFGVSTGRWPEGAAVTATGSLYGPFPAQPQEAAAPPPGSPVAGTASATVTAPGTVTVQGPVAGEAGFYTWQWTIDKQAQAPATRSLLLESFTDRFGQLVETQITPSGIVALSAVSQQQAPLSAELTDVLVVSAEGGAWLRSEGEAVPVVFRGEAYHVPGADPPPVTDEVPEDARLIGSVTLLATGPGTYLSPPLTAPDAGTGHVVWRWSIRAEDQPERHRGLVAEWSDRFGLPAETTMLLQPELSTRAQPTAAAGTDIHDVAIVRGSVPAIAPTLRFELYRQPAGQAQPRCDATTLVASTAPLPVDRGPGEYRSPPVRADKEGTYWWVEVLRSHAGTEITRGRCGQDNERTVVRTPPPTPPILAFTGARPLPGIAALLAGLALVLLGTALTLHGRRSAMPHGAWRRRGRRR